MITIFHNLIYNWDHSKFTSHILNVPHGHWNHLHHQHSFMSSLAQSLNITSANDWLKVNQGAILKHGGAGLLAKYSNSLSKILTTLVPEYKEMCRSFIMKVKQDLQLETMQDVVNVPFEYQNKERKVTIQICEAKRTKNDATI